MSLQPESSEKFEGWCVVELMGHNVIAGYVTEQVIGGAAMLRVDVPPSIDVTGITRTDSEGFTKFFAPSAVYGITPTSEAHAREAASRIKARPVSLWIVPEPKLITQRVAAPDYEQERLDMDIADEGDDEEEAPSGFPEWGDSPF